MKGRRNKPVKCRVRGCLEQLVNVNAQRCKTHARQHKLKESNKRARRWARANPDVKRQIDMKHYYLKGYLTRKIRNERNKEQYLEYLRLYRERTKKPCERCQTLIHRASMHCQPCSSKLIPRGFIRKGRGALSLI